MSGCSCIYVGEGFDEIIMLRDDRLRAAKAHICTSCGRTIPKWTVAHEAA